MFFPGGYVYYLVHTLVGSLDGPSFIFCSDPPCSILLTSSSLLFSLLLAYQSFPLLSFYFAIRFRWVRMHSVHM